MTSRTQVRTYVRVKPLQEHEVVNANAPLSVVSCASSDTLVFNPSTLRSVAPLARFSTSRGRQHYDQLYSFDGVFAPGCDEDEIYDRVARPLLKTAMNGSNTSIFAYGATGCGKSHTINALQDRLGDEIMRLVEQLPDDSVSIKLTYLQLYNEKIIDLLPRTSGTTPVFLEIRDASAAGKGRAQVTGLTEYFPQNSDEIRQLISRGNHNRIVAATQANSQSSRSHAVLTFHIERFSSDGSSSTTSTLSVIDLAGNERAQSTNNRGHRLKEGANINRSLLALGNCITARASRRAFIPYRESKLTRLLQASLHGNCETAMIVCISASLDHFDETKNSLEYGKRAASISRPSQLRVQDPRARRLALLRDLEAQVANLSLWKREVIEGLEESLPELKTQIRLYGGSAISGKDFVQACIDTQAMVMAPYIQKQHRQDEISSPRRLNTCADEERRAYNPISPLKRTHQCARTPSQGSITDTSHAVKRAHT